MTGENRREAVRAPDPLDQEVAEKPTRRVTRIRSMVALGILTVALLAPFLGKAFHADDPLFLWAAQHIVQHPADPYGFDVTWYTTKEPMWKVAQNPPLASYYIAGAASLLGWSEIALHAAFLPTALAAVLGTYLLARKFTGLPAFATAAALVAPGFMLSSTTVMCDVLMLALWVFAAMSWLAGEEQNRPLLLGISGLLVTAAGLTKYYGLALIPLLLIYSLFYHRRATRRLLYLLIPAAFLAAYQLWTKALYGAGLLSNAAAYAQAVGSLGIYRTVVSLSFTGGCVLPALLFAPLLWTGRIVAGVAAGIAGLLLASLAYGRHDSLIPHMALFVAGGVSVLLLAISDCRRRRDPGSVFLLLWVSGTWVFVACVNWGVNGRSVLPMIPAVGILLARRLEFLYGAAENLWRMKWLPPLVISGAVSLWVASADAGTANSSRMMAQYARDHLRQPGTETSFQGHWGFQYYMQSLGFRPFALEDLNGEGGVVVIHENSYQIQAIPAPYVIAQEAVSFPLAAGAATMSRARYAGYYSFEWGPLPYALGPANPDVFQIVHWQNPGQPSVVH